MADDPKRRKKRRRQILIMRGLGGGSTRVERVWILAEGAWDDAAVWVDIEQWQDS